MKLDIHEAADLFPLMKGQEYQELVESIKTHGLLKPIELFEERILDGRNRYLACLDLGIEPNFIRLSEDINPFEYVWAVNAERRHLDPSQKITILLFQKQKSEDWQQEQLSRKTEANRKRSEAAKAQPRTDDGRRLAERSGHLSRDKTPDNWTHTELAQEAQVSPATAGRAQSLFNKRLDLAEKVAAGELSLTNALRIAKKESLAQEIPLPSGKYRIIYADPPWKYSDQRTTFDNYGPAEKHFPTMSISELSALSIPADDNSILFLWTTSPMLEDAFKVINAWGFKYKASFVWDKVKHNYGHYNSVRHEFLLIATKGSCTPDNHKLFDSVVTMERSKIHSEKPEIFYEIIETLYSHGNKIELFLRGTPRPGWDGWGNEVL